MRLLSHEDAIALTERMGKWYLAGYKDGHASAQKNGPALPGQGAGDAYEMGYSAGLHDALVEALK